MHTKSEWTDGQNESHRNNEFQIANCPLVHAKHLRKFAMNIIISMGGGIHSVLPIDFAKILGQTLLLFVSSAIFLKAKFTAYGIFSGWFAVLLQSLCGFSFGILLFALLKKQVPIILYLIVVELIISSLSGNVIRNYKSLLG